MDEAAAILAIAIVNSSPTLQDELRTETQKGVDDGAAYIAKYFVAALQAIHQAKQKKHL